MIAALAESRARIEAEADARTRLESGTSARRQARHDRSALGRDSRTRSARRCRCSSGRAVHARSSTAIPRCAVKPSCSSRSAIASRASSSSCCRSGAASQRRSVRAISSMPVRAVIDCSVVRRAAGVDRRSISNRRGHARDRRRPRPAAAGHVQPRPQRADGDAARAEYGACRSRARGSATLVRPRHRARHRRRHAARACSSRSSRRAPPKVAPASGSRSCERSSNEHRATIDVRSETGHGAEFVVSFPRWGYRVAERARLLIVDDDRAVVDYLVEATRRSIRRVTARPRRTKRSRARARRTSTSSSATSRCRACAVPICSRRSSKLKPRQAVLLITAFGSIELAVETVRAGACDFVTKPFKIETLVLAIERALRERTMRREIVRLASRSRRRRRGSGLVAKSAAMASVLDVARRAARSNATVLITGESGVGKGALARWIHERSEPARRSARPVNCAALPSEPHRSRAVRRATRRVHRRARVARRPVRRGARRHAVPRRDRRHAARSAGEAPARAGVVPRAPGRWRRPRSRSTCG